MQFVCLHMCVSHKERVCVCVGACVCMCECVTLCVCVCVCVHACAHVLKTEHDVIVKQYERKFEHCNLYIIYCDNCEDFL